MRCAGALAALALASLSGCMPAEMRAGEKLLVGVIRAHRPAPRPVADANFAESLITSVNGPGLFVGQPVTNGRDVGLTQFGAGCGRWLHLYASGQLGMSRTPSWVYADDVRIGLRQNDFCLRPANLRDWARALGGIDSAAGTLTGSGQNLALTYQLYDPDGVPIGPAVQAKGSPVAIVTALPEMAAKLDVLLGVKPLDAPVATGLSPGDLRAIGSVGWAYLYPGRLPAGVESSLARLSKTDALAGLMCLELSHFHLDAGWKPFCGRLWDQAPENSLVLSAIANSQGDYAAQYLRITEDMAARYPNNYLLASAIFNENQMAGDVEEEMAAAKRAVQTDPQNAEAWCNLNYALVDENELERHSKAWRHKYQALQARLLVLEKESEACAEQGVKVNPLYAPGWRQLGLSAMMQCCAREAHDETWQALKVDPNNYDAYRQGLDLFSRDWNLNPVELVRMAWAAAAHSDHVFLYGEYLKDRFAKAGELNALPPILEVMEQKDPFNITSWTTAGDLELDGPKPNFAAATQDFDHALAMSHTSCLAWAGLGRVLLEQNQAGRAEPLIRKALAIDDSIGAIHLELSQCLAKEGKTAEAKAEWSTAAQLGNS